MMTIADFARLQRGHKVYTANPTRLHLVVRVGRFVCWNEHDSFVITGAKGSTRRRIFTRLEVFASAVEAEAASSIESEVVS
jgi:hypothetical protein